MDRKLASIKKISEIRDIPGKDRIALAIIDGWSVIIQKAEFKPGDLCVFFEIDSILPDAELSERSQDPDDEDGRMSEPRYSLPA